MVNIQRLYNKYGLSERVIEHCKRVRDYSLLINEMVDLRVDEGLLDDAALLHDLGAVVYPHGRSGLSDFELVWGHQVVTRKLLEQEGFEKLAVIASNHNIHGLTKEESKQWGYEPGINLLPESNESKILAFSDSMRERFVKDGDCIHIHNEYYKNLLKKHHMLKKAEKRKRRLFNHLTKHGMSYEKVLEWIK